MANAATVPASVEAVHTSWRDRAFLLTAGSVYLLVSLALLATLDRDWSANVDVQTFLAAARSFRDGGSPFDLYQVSRETSPWPFAYPPLFALIIAPFVAVADGIAGVSSDSLPVLIAIRAPIWAADIAIAALIHRIVWKRSGTMWLGRTGTLLWLFSPILFYHTLVQAHVETLWLLPVLAAYERISEGRRDWQAMALLALAVTAKQTALLFALPFGLLLIAERRWRDVVLFPLLVAGVFASVSLPFFLHSDDYRYMITEFVAEMPVQVQSWQVWALAPDSYRIDQVRTTFPTVRYVLGITVVASALLSIMALAQRRSWTTVGLLIALGFFLTAHKIIGYHYPILILWLILYGLTERQFTSLTFALGWTTWVLVSPYYASWANPAHLAVYALLGTINSIYYLYLLVNVLRTPDAEDPASSPAAIARGRGAPQEEIAHNPVRGATSLLTWGALYFWSFALAVLATPIRVVIQDQIPDSEPLTQLGALIILLLVLLWLTLVLTRPFAAWLTTRLHLPNAEIRPIRWQRAHTGVWLAFGGLFFTWFTMNAEITRLFERGLWVAWGLD